MRNPLLQSHYPHHHPDPLGLMEFIFGGRQCRLYWRVLLLLLHFTLGGIICQRPCCGVKVLENRLIATIEFMMAVVHLLDYLVQMCWILHLEGEYREEKGFN